MNLLQLVLKQMRQRALSTWLTLLSVVLGVGLATAVLVLLREGQRLFTQADFGYDVLVGPAQGSPLQLTLNSVYHMDVSPGVVDYGIYKQLLANRGTVRLAVPIAKGDTYEGLPLVGTVPRMFNYTNDASDAGPQPIVTEGANTMAPFEYRVGKSFALAEGRMFHPQKFEAVLGAEVTQRTATRLNVGGKFKATHGNPLPGETPDVHDQEWQVVGRLAPTGTAADRAIYIPLTSFFAIAEHEAALKTINEIQKGTDATRLPSATPPAEAPKFRMDGDKIVLDLPESEWKISAVFVRTRSAPMAFQLIYSLKNSGKATAVNPATVMREFFSVFLRPSSLILLAVAILVVIVAAVGILVAIYNSVSARLKEIAILRALGATRGKVLSIICMEAGLIGLVGSLVGIVAGLVLVGLVSKFVPENLGQIQPLRLETAMWVRLLGWLPGHGSGTGLRESLRAPIEVLCFVGFVGLAVLGGLVPALKAYRVPVATNLNA